MNSCAEDPDCMEDKYLYSFKSQKSHYTYLVWVEKYPYNMYAVKFHLKGHQDSPDKYRHMTGANEARPVIFTCIKIMHEFFIQDELSSFGFVGENMLKEEDKSNTKRYKVYSKIVSTFFGSETFNHFVYDANSTYLLLRKTEMAKDKSLKKKIESLFEKNYWWFNDNFPDQE